jgi:hypothetical protein
MDQFNEFESSDPFSPLLPPLPLTDASNLPDALTLPPLAIYPSREALFEAIQSWARLRGYAFINGKSTKTRGGYQKVTYACDRRPPTRSLNMSTNRIRETQYRGSGCLFSVIGLETPSLGWEVRYRPDTKFNTHNHLPTRSPAAHPSHRRLPINAQNVAQNLFLAGNNYLLIYYIKAKTNALYRCSTTAKPDFYSTNCP